MRVADAAQDAWSEAPEAPGGPIARGSAAPGGTWQVSAGKDA